jgi:Uma2 family endonuclease
MATKAKPRFEDIDQILAAFDHIPGHRIKVNPPPGSATEADWERLQEKGERLYELVEGTLVEKTMGYVEAFLAQTLGRLLGNFAEEHNLGAVIGADGAARLMPGLIRVPDVSFIRWERYPKPGVVSDVPVVDLAPDLAVEVLSKSNTRGEMERKLKEYFLAGVRRVWFVDPQARTVKVYTTPDSFTTFEATETLTDEGLLAGFALPLSQLFARLGAPPATPKKRKKK